jgi:polyisoprenoid-binding protein YceI
MGPTVFKQLTWLGTALVAAGMPYAQSAPRAYAIEPAHTVVSFEVRHLGIAKQRGLFDSVSGQVLLDAQADNGSVEIVVNARSVETGNTATRTFLRGKSFLNVEEFSEIIYKAGRVIFEQHKPVRIEGELTLLGVSRAVSLSISGYTCEDDSSGSNRCVLDAATTFKRSEFGMNHYMALVSDDVRLAIHGVTTRAL